MTTVRMARKPTIYTHTPFPDPPLTTGQVDHLRYLVGRYIAMHLDYTGRLPTSADADHSSLLHRLLSGKAPTRYPPPLMHSYPWYEIAEAEESGAPFSVELWEAITAWPDIEDAWKDAGTAADGAQLLTHPRLRGTYRLERATVHVVRSAPSWKIVPTDGFLFTRVSLPPEEGDR